MTEADLLGLQRRAFGYFWTHSDPDTGLVADSSRSGSDSSIAAVGMALACYPVAAKRGWVSREQLAARALAALRTLSGGAMDGRPGAIGRNGFFYHFLDMRTGVRSRRSEVSTIDTAILVAGILTAVSYFDRETPAERTIRELGHAIYRRVDWPWALDGGETVSMGWRPGIGFHRTRWEGYSEALLLYVLGLGSPTHPLPRRSYTAWARRHRWKRIYGVELLYAGQLFVHALAHAWLDLEGLEDAYMRGRGIDYFENSRRALHVQQRYAVRNPRGFEGYSERSWGISASDGPGPTRRIVSGRSRRFWDYKGRGVPWGADDGTLAPPAVAACIPFDPALVFGTLRELARLAGGRTESLLSSVNPTYGDDRGAWVSGTRFGIDQGPVVLMIENHLSGMIWDITRRSAPFVRGLERAGFRGAWLDQRYQTEARSSDRRDPRGTPPG